ncbi:MAG TPA: DUF2341 domain-containing protein [Polyangiaceae bacterium]|nr:MAG: hypothetical protein BWY17_00592 [Deltaproteobacteria bacterium ADurb.Bin207]HNT00019.1 DUF2341 domain-containing protein [Polyangiaceae bacterium]HNZ23378.1 DUF2341 domain-containing protein [Polyangiaceae bacterium]HOD22812.1 DUF2341 domain-containing protein [Polyangiaceae bacterium]HOE50200.1 DUF2341 domain-containing protein [Polyangiaceae bacterium]
MSLRNKSAARTIAFRLSLPLIGIIFGACVLDAEGRGTSSVSCGNEILEEGEECDGSLVADMTCMTLAYSGGELRCSKTCTFDVSRCGRCGDGIREGNEQCDGNDLAGQTCASVIGLADGELRCTSQCRWDLTNCSKCLNGVREGNEQCDVIVPSTATCETVVGRQSGEVRCSDDCTFDTTRCHTCGDGIIEGPEECDGNELGAATCETFHYASGVLSCKNDCTLNKSQCLVPSADWGDLQWRFRRLITVPNKLVDETLSGFPLLVTVVDPSLAAHVTSSADFRFTLGGSTTVLAHEIVSWNSENGALVAWVRLPALSALFDTKILMYYGNPSPPSPAPSIPVWTDGFSAVWHLDEEDAATSHVNSAADRFHGAKAGNHAVAGKVGRAQRFDGQNQHIQIVKADGISLGNSNVTISAWIRTKAHQRAGLVTKSPAAQWPPESKAFGMLDNVVVVTNGFGVWLSSTKPVNDNQWRYVVWTQQKDVVGLNERWILYVDGVQNGKGDYTTGEDGTGHSLWIGSPMGTLLTNYWKGDIDEVSISNVARSAAWIAASYRNQNAPESFIIVGDEQTVLVGP